MTRNTRKRTILIFVFFFALFVATTSPKSAGLVPPRIIHVLVALCDNQYQGIVPVPARIGNGDDPGNNLYWGAAYGVSSFFQKSTDWKLIAEVQKPKPEVLQRLVFQHASK